MIHLTRAGKPELTLFEFERTGGELIAPWCLIYVTMAAGQELYEVRRVLGDWQRVPTPIYVNQTPLVANTDEFVGALLEGKKVPITLQVSL